MMKELVLKLRERRIEAILIMKRDLKLLYRQRGSAARNIDNDQIVITTKKRDIDFLHENILPDDIINTEYDNCANLTDISKDYESGKSNQVDNIKEFNTGVLKRKKTDSYEDEKPKYSDSVDINKKNDIHHIYHIQDPPDIFKFDDLRITKISSSITTIATIEVLTNLIKNLFEKHLIYHSKVNFENSTTKKEKLSFKFDLKIFKAFIDQLLKDLKDILDINLSNNELCHQWKMILNLKNDFITDYLFLQNENLKLSLNKDKFKDLEEKILLNKKLKTFGNDWKPINLPLSLSTFNSSGIDESEKLENLNDF